MNYHVTTFLATLNSVVVNGVIQLWSTYSLILYV